MQNVPASHQGIIQRSQVVTLATLNLDGAPQVTAMWFLWEDGQLRLSLNNTRQKAKNLQRDPRLSAFFVDPDDPYRTVEIRGTAVVEPDPDYALADRVGAKYGGANLREMDAPGESRIAVTVVPEKVLTFGAQQ